MRTPLVGLALAACTLAGPPAEVGRTSATRGGGASVGTTTAAQDEGAPVDVTSAARGGGAFVGAQGLLQIHGRTVDTNVLQGVSVAADGTVAYARRLNPDADGAPTDVFRVRPGGRPERVTRDGCSERPFFLPDGSLLWTSSADGGRVGWIRDGRRLNRFPETRVPAFPEPTRFDGGRVLFDAGEGLYALDPATGATERLP